MRNVNCLLVSLVLLFPVFSWAENDIMNERYFSEGMTWKTMTIETYMLSEIVSVNKGTYVLQGDTLIGERIYHKLVDENGQLIASMTEDGKKIYIRYNETDMLLYDFGVEVGDTIVQDFSVAGTQCCDGPCKNCVVRIDTVPLLDGRKAKRIYYDNRSTTDIEYVGGDHGILTPIFMPQIPLSIDWHSYACYSLSGVIIYEYNPGDCEKIDNTDRADNVHSHPASASKYLQDNHILIIRGDKTYTLTGQRIE